MCELHAKGSSLAWRQLPRVRPRGWSAQECVACQQYTDSKWRKVNQQDESGQCDEANGAAQPASGPGRVQGPRSKVMRNNDSAHRQVPVWSEFSTAWTTLQSRDWTGTPKGLLDAQTPDISVFFFELSEPACYYKPTAKYPTPSFLTGHFMGSVWNHGDMLTHRVWTCPTGNWSKGQDFEAEPKRSGSLDSLDFEPAKRKKKIWKHKESSNQGEANNDLSQDWMFLAVSRSKRETKRQKSLRKNSKNYNLPPPIQNFPTLW